MMNDGEKPGIADDGTDELTKFARIWESPSKKTDEEDAPEK